MLKIIPSALLVVFMITMSEVSLAKTSERIVLQAIREGDFEAVREFIRNGNDIDGLYGNDEFTLLNYAIKQKMDVIAKQLIDFGADPNLESHDKTPLMFCIQNRRYDLMRYLVRNGANPDHRNRHGNTALIYAARAGKKEYVKYLVESGADLEIRNNNGYSAIDYTNGNFQDIAFYFSKINKLRDKALSMPAISDGPYVEWKNKNQVSMYYYYADSNSKIPVLHEKNIEILQDTAVVKGFGNDNRNYVITHIKQADPSVYEGVSKIMSVGDLHGQYDALVDYLLINGVINDRLEWIWGDGHVVFLGDILDRGSEVTETLWLIYQLDLQARKFGGRVHMLLGNHEVMALTNDTRYLNPKYELLSKYFCRDYALFYNPDTELGAWLRTRNVIIKINGILFSHAGISPEVLAQGLGLDEINNLVRAYLVNTRYPKDPFLTNLIMNAYGPLWYRGYHYPWEGASMISQHEVDNALQFYNASRIVIAHTKCENILLLFDEKVIDINVDITSDNYLPEGLLVEQGVFYKLNGDGSKTKLI